MGGASHGPSASSLLAQILPLLTHIYNIYIILYHIISYYILYYIILYYMYVNVVVSINCMVYYHNGYFMDIICYMDIIWILWILYGYYMDIIWISYGYRMDIIWILYG